MFFQYICKDVFKGNGTGFTYNEVLLGCTASMDRSTTFCVGEVLETKIFTPAALHDFDDPRRVNKLVRV